MVLCCVCLFVFFGLFWGIVKMKRIIRTPHSELLATAAATPAQLVPWRFAGSRISGYGSA